MDWIFNDSCYYRSRHNLKSRDALRTFRAVFFVSEKYVKDEKIHSEKKNTGFESESAQMCITARFDSAQISITTRFERTNVHYNQI